MDGNAPSKTNAAVAEMFKGFGGYVQLTQGVLTTSCFARPTLTVNLLSKIGD